MISFLSAIVVMVAIGPVVQRSDALSKLFDPAPPEVVLVQDEVIVEAGKLRAVTAKKVKVKRRTRKERAKTGEARKAMSVKARNVGASASGASETTKPMTTMSNWVREA